MFENPGRFLTLTIALIAAAALSMLVPDRPFRMGLDLQGGTRLVYRFDFQKALEGDLITEADLANPEKLLRDTVEIIRDRIDPQGVLEASIRPEGEDRIVIELPGDEFARVNTVASLGAAITSGALTLELVVESEEELANFPVTGGVVGIGDETIRYTRRDGNSLMGLERGEMETPPIAHAAGDEVKLLSDDAVRILIENTGSMQFYIGALPADYSAQGSDFTVERGKLDEWILAHPEGPLSDFNRLSTDQGGPMAGLKWFPMRVDSGVAPPPLAQRRIEPLIQQTGDYIFTGDDLERVQIGQDEFGYPAVVFEMKTIKRNDFGDFTGSHVKDSMAIVLNDEIVTLAVINSKLPGGGRIDGGSQGFTQDEVNDMVTVLRSGSLRIKPELEHEERVGATLGDEYVKKGVTSSLLALVVVMLFMAAYYRRLGLFAALSLGLNLVLLMGVMAFLRATLTLPGIAGLILTVGMAVDSNILIYERIREERARGLKIGQATENGFKRAFVTIFDMNVTTLLSAIILYNFGTGPIRGFATTLIIGILSTLFSVLVGTKLLVQFSLDRGAQEFSMARLVTQTKIAFMSLSKVALPVSILLVVTSIGLFAWRPDREKLGIDFLGGFSLTVRMDEPQEVEDVRQRIGGIEGSIGSSADVKAVLGSGGADGYTDYRITYKFDTGDDAGEAQSAQETGERAIRDALSGLLLEDPVQVEAGGGEGSPTFNGRLAFNDPHPTTDIQNLLTSAGMTDVQVSEVTGRRGRYTFNGATESEMAISALSTRIANAFRDQVDTAGGEFTLAQPIPESSIVGASVSGELRDKAIQAVLLSLFVTVMYIRVRFREYSYGFAVVAALVHDVAITLGALTLVNWLGLIEAEINLAMIAAFLTIIGWSQNDTIVIFDRVRENLPRVKGNLADVLNLSINQTLSRTLLTSVTTLVAVMILFAFNVGTRNVLEGFTFAVLIGILTGTYSTIFIASPVLLWLESRGGGKPDSASGSTPAKAA